MLSSTHCCQEDFENIKGKTSSSCTSALWDFEVKIHHGRQPSALSEDVEQSEECSRKLGRLTSPFVLRRNASVMARYLPAKFGYVLLCRPTETQRALYRHVTAALGNSESLLQLITLLEKASSSPSLLRRKVDQEDGSDVQSYSAALLAVFPQHLFSNNSSSTKLRMVDQLLHNIWTTTPEKVVLINHYTAIRDLLSRLLTSVRRPSSRIDGCTPTRKCHGIIDDFSRGSPENCFPFLLFAKSGSVGINLVGASRLVLFDVN